MIGRTLAALWFPCLMVVATVGLLYGALGDHGPDPEERAETFEEFAEAAAHDRKAAELRLRALTASRETLFQAEVESSLALGFSQAEAEEWAAEWIADRIERERERIEASREAEDDYWLRAQR